MKDLSFGLTVTAAVTVVMFVVGVVTAMYCRWVERGESQHNRTRTLSLFAKSSARFVIPTRSD
jgi:hypothetical protein